MFSRGCEDDESGNGQQYGEFAIRMFILDETGDADKNEIIFTKCTSCLEVTGKDNIEKTEKCIKEKLYKDFMQYETHCNCIDDETGIARKKCIWRGIELQCGHKHDKCNEKIIGSNVIPRYFLYTTKIVEIEYESNQGQHRPLITAHWTPFFSRLCFILWN